MREWSVQRFSDWPEKIPYLQWGCGILLALACVPLHFYLSQNGGHAFDFWSLYAASHTLSHAPASIYDTNVSGAEFHALITQTIAGKDGAESYIFIYPPLVALMIWPLHFLSYAQAYILFSGLNLLAAFWCAKMVMKLANALGLARFGPLLGSAMWFNLATFFILLNGQISLLLCSAFVWALFAICEKRWTLCAVLIALLLHAKPLLFAPLAVYLFLRMDARARSICVLSCVGIFILAGLVLGWNIWPSYLQLLIEVGGTAQGFYANIIDMVNLRGLLTALFGNDAFATISMLCSGLYVLVMLLALWLGLRVKDSVALPLVFALGAFFSPWCHYHDLILLLPGGVFLLADLQAKNEARRFVPLYLIITAWSALIPFAWGGRAALLVAIFLAGKASVASAKNAG